MILGPVAEIEAKIEKANSNSLSTQAFRATDLLGNYKFWPNGQVYYAYETNLTPQQQSRLNTAIEHWRDATMLRFYPRGTGARIVFRRATDDRDCSSGVGHNGGIVYTNLGEDCDLADTIHEIGHAVALNHEHSRCDRDNSVNVYSGRAYDPKRQLDKICATGVNLSGYDPYSIMHYPKWAYGRTEQSQQDCLYNNIDSACTILPKSGSGINKDRMGESQRLTSTDASSIFKYYRDKSPCVNSVGLPNCTWRGFNVTLTAGGSYNFTVTSPGKRIMYIQGNQVPVAAGLNKRNSNGTYQNLQYKIIPTDGYQAFDSGNLAPGSYQWYVHGTSGSGSVDMFPRY